MSVWSLIKGKKEFSKDIVYNVGASLVLVGTMQIVVYPFLAWKYVSAEYGEILTVMGIVQTISATCGNALNNVRLMLDTEYGKDGKKGDFNLLLIVLTVTSVIITTGIVLGGFGQSVGNSIFLVLYVAMGIINSYFCVYFRIILNFKKVFLQNLFGAAGLGVGILFVYYIPIWPIPFVLSELIQLVVIWKYCDLYKEPYGITDRMGSTILKLLILMATTLSGNLINYLDRLLLYPLLGGDAVSVYSVASFFGKTFGIIMTPTAGVLLGYYSQKEYKMTCRKFWGINVAALIGGVVFLGISMLFSPIITRLLYPKVYDEAAVYILWANIASIISVICILTQSAVLKFAPAWIQLLKEGIYGGLYIFLGMYMLKKYGLMGFCTASIIANISKLVILYFFGHIYVRRGRNFPQR